VLNRDDVFNSFFKFPSSGYRSDSDIKRKGEWCSIWSSSISNYDQNWSAGLRFISDVGGILSSSSSNGIPVRCIKNNDK
jgi:hypothetical protein